MIEVTRPGADGGEPVLDASSPFPREEVIDILLKSGVDELTVSYLMGRAENEWRRLQEAQ